MTMHCFADVTSSIPGWPIFSGHRLAQDAPEGLQAGGGQPTGSGHSFADQSA